MQLRWMLVGGIASGKSEVRRLLEAHGVATIDADSIGHLVLQPEGAAFEDVATRWPEVVVDGTIDRRQLGGIVFNDPAQLATLESMTHPHIFDMIKTRAEGLSTVAVEMPLPGRRLGEEWRQVVVDCRDEVRVGRAVQRGLTEEEARSRLTSQPSRAEWLATADVVIPNHGTVEDLGATVQRLVNEVMADNRDLVR